MGEGFAKVGFPTAGVAIDEEGGGRREVEVEDAVEGELGRG